MLVYTQPHMPERTVSMIQIPFAQRRRAWCGGALLLLVASAPIATAATPDTWLVEAQQRCEAEQDEQARCNDPAWLAAEAQRLETRDVARRAAIRGNRQEQRAVRELLQGSNLCKGQVQSYCANAGTGCNSRMVTLCRSIAAQQAQCATQAQQYCRQQRIGNCSETIKRQCPHGSKQDVDTILARYDDLNANQQARLRQLAAQLDGKDSTNIGHLIAQLTRLLGLR